ncbi:hypothetical protein ABTN83_19625, partial [Acinetobacter baumannii]
FAGAQAEQPFSFDSTPGTLPKTVVPLRYSIRLSPDFTTLALHGNEIIDIEVGAPTAQLTLNAINTTFEVVSVDGTQTADVATDAAAQT